jgi:hypothetical protein
MMLIQPQPAQFRLAQIYRAGTGMPVDLAEAKKWSDLAAHCRTATDCFPSAAPTDGPSATANETVFTDNRDLRPAAEQGDPVAQFRLGERYYDERRRDPARDAETLRWFRLAAAQGNAQAEALLGYIGFVLDALAVWYVTYLCRSLLRRRLRVLR